VEKACFSAKKGLSAMARDTLAGGGRAAFFGEKGLFLQEKVPAYP
jgi:hypothetical protein